MLFLHGKCFSQKFKIMEIQGKIKLIGDTQTVGNNFRKREMVVTTEEPYPQDLMVEFVQDKTELLDAYRVGENVKISINLRGREWINPQGEAKYFNSIQGWRVESVAGKAIEDKPTVPDPENFKRTSGLHEEDQDDLPF